MAQSYKHRLQQQRRDLSRKRGTSDRGSISTTNAPATLAGSGAGAPGHPLKFAGNSKGQIFVIDNQYKNSFIPLIQVGQEQLQVPLALPSTLPHYPKTRSSNTPGPGTTGPATQTHRGTKMDAEETELRKKSVRDETETECGVNTCTQE